MKKRGLCILLLLSLILAACGNSSEVTHLKSTAAEEPATEPVAGPVAADFSWIVTTGTLTITGHGAMPDYGYDLGSPWKAERDRIERVVISEGITHIGNQAFYDCDQLSAVILPKTVTSIGEQAFRSCENLICVNIPKNITYIGDYAFGDCWSLSSIAIYQKVEHIGTEAFSNCKALSEISVESTNQYYTSENGILFNKDKTALIRYPAEGGQKSYYIPSSVTVIESGAFEACSDLQAIMIPSSVTTIGNFAFSGCFNLVSLFIPESVTSIGWEAFSYCYKLTEIDVAVANPNYASEDGILLSKDRQTLLLYPQGKEITEPLVPKGVTKIGGRAFKTNRALVSVTIADGVTEIGVYAFWYCERLRSVSLPDTVTSIGSDAFSDCESLESITFHGTMAQWESIEKDGFTDCTFTVHCTDGTCQSN